MGGVTTKGAAAAVEGALVVVASALGAGGLVADGTETVLVGVTTGVRKPAPTPTAVLTIGAAEPLREDIAGGDSQYAANIGNTVHLSPPAAPRWTDGWSALPAPPLIQKIKSLESRLFAPLDVMEKKCYENRFFWEKRTLKKCCTFSTKKIQKKYGKLVLYIDPRCNGRKMLKKTTFYYFFSYITSSLS